ncbi:MAG: V-type ATP synthase subunit B [Promethearchaeota archaeon]
MSIEYNTIHSIKSPLLFLKPLKNHQIKMGGMVRVKTRDGIRTGQVLTVSDEVCVVQVIQGTFGISKGDTSCVFLDEVFKFGVSREMLGRDFSGLGKPLDGKPLLPEEMRDITGNPLNPVRREYPKDVIETGVKSIDGLTTLVRGQKLPIFSGQGLPHNRLVAQIINNAHVTTHEPFVIIFCGIGLLAEEALYFQERFAERGGSKIITFINLVSDPATERLLLPRIALTVAEFLAFTHNMHVLVVMTDISNYAESLREISNVKGEIPARKGFPGYMYSDFASLYERAGRVKGKTGSITQIPVISMPNDDISHPIPDLTGYITEGQLVLNRNYHKMGIFPPIYPLSSLSRLMKDSIGVAEDGRILTREDHADITSQLYASYAKSLEIREMESILGAESLSEIDRKYLRFGKLFETRFIHQEESSLKFTFDETLTIAWEIISATIPISHLIRIQKKFIEKYYIHDQSALDHLID